MMPTHVVDSMMRRSSSRDRSFFSSAGRLFMMDDSGLDDSREKASWLIRWCVMAPTLMWAGLATVMESRRAPAPPPPPREAEAVAAAAAAAAAAPGLGEFLALEGLDVAPELASRRAPAAAATAVAS